MHRATSELEPLSIPSIFCVATTAKSLSRSSGLFADSHCWVSTPKQHIFAAENFCAIFLIRMSYEMERRNGLPSVNFRYEIQEYFLSCANCQEKSAIGYRRYNKVINILINIKNVLDQYVRKLWWLTTNNIHFSYFFHWRIKLMYL